jgi:hypothetical protein
MKHIIFIICLSEHQTLTFLLARQTKDPQLSPPKAKAGTTTPHFSLQNGFTFTSEQYSRADNV